MPPASSPSRVSTTKPLYDAFWQPTPLRVFYPYSTRPPPRQYPIFAIFVTNFWYTWELIPQPRRRYTLTAPRSAHQPADERSPDDGEWSAPSNTAASPPRAHCPCPHTPTTSPPAPVSTQAPRPPPRHRHTASAAPPTPSHRAGNAPKAHANLHPDREATPQACETPRHRRCWQESKTACKGCQVRTATFLTVI
jgi:hypothetical protein